MVPSDQRPHPANLIFTPTGLLQQRANQYTTRRVMPPAPPPKSMKIERQASAPDTIHPGLVHKLKRRNCLPKIVDSAEPDEQSPATALTTAGNLIERTLKRGGQIALPDQLRNRRRVQQVR